MVEGNKTKNLGFSLIELMTVISIMAVIVVLSIPSFLAVKIRAARAEMSLQLRAISTVAQGFHAENSIYPENSSLGIAIQNGLTDAKGCSKAYSASMINTMGYTSANCEDLRYLYFFSRGALNAHPNAVNLDGVKYFTISAQSSYVSIGPTEYQAGSQTAVNPKLCMRSAGTDPSFFDAWLSTEDGVLILSNNSSYYDALQQGCLKKN